MPFVLSINSNTFLIVFYLDILKLKIFNLYAQVQKIMILKSQKLCFASLAILCWHVLYAAPNFAFDETES